MIYKTQEIEEQKKILTLVTSIYIYSKAEQQRRSFFR